MILLTLLIEKRITSLILLDKSLFLIEWNELLKNDSCFYKFMNYELWPHYDMVLFENILCHLDKLCKYYIFWPDTNIWLDILLIYQKYSFIKYIYWWDTYKQSRYLLRGCEILNISAHIWGKCINWQKCLLITMIMVMKVTNMDMINTHLKLIWEYTAQIDWRINPRTLLLSYTHKTIISLTIQQRKSK